MRSAPGGCQGIDAVGGSLSKGKDSRCLAIDIWSRSSLPHREARRSLQNTPDLPDLPLIALFTAARHSTGTLLFALATACSKSMMLLWEAEHLLVSRYGAHVRRGRGSRGPPYCRHDSPGDESGMT